MTAEIRFNAALTRIQDRGVLIRYNVHDGDKQRGFPFTHVHEDDEITPRAWHTSDAKRLTLWLRWIDGNAFSRGIRQGTPIPYRLMRFAQVKCADILREEFERAGFYVLPTTSARQPVIVSLYPVPGE